MSFSSQLSKDIERAEKLWSKTPHNEEVLRLIKGGMDDVRCHCGAKLNFEIRRFAASLAKTVHEDLKSDPDGLADLIECYEEELAPNEWGLYQPAEDGSEEEEKRLRLFTYAALKESRKWMRSQIHLIPDLYAICPSPCRQIYAVEVTNTNGIANKGEFSSKLDRYRHLFWMLDCVYWELELVEYHFKTSHMDAAWFHWDMYPNNGRAHEWKWFRETEPSRI